MDVRQVELFAAVVEHGSLTAAARAVGVTQPAVSAALGRLERSVGFPLFEREGRGVVPTAEGLLLHQEAVRALAGLAQLDVAAAAIGAASRGTLTIASNPGPGIAWLPEVIAAFRRERPDIAFTLLTRSSREVRDLVAGRAFDLGIAEPPFDRHDGILRRYRFAAVAALPPDHPLASHAVLTPDLLDDEPVVAMVPTHGTWAPLARAFEEAGARLRVVAECEFFATALNLARHGAGICLVDPISAADISGPDLVVRPFRPVIPYEVALLRPARGSLSRLAEAFARTLDAHIRPFLETRPA